MKKMDISIIIPAYNEGQTIGGLVRKIRELYFGFEIIVVNDGSMDNTATAAKRAGAIVYSHPYNIGNGAAVKSGIRIASGDILVFMDGDAQHEPEDIGRLVEYFPDFDMVVGARSRKRQASWGRAIGNKVYNRLASYVAKFPIEDLTSGFRAVKSDIAHDFLYLLPNTYSYPTTLTLCVLRAGKSVKYISANTHSRKIGKSKIRVLSDGIRFFLIITKICTLYSPLRIFLPLCVIMFLMGLGNYLYTFFAWGRFTNMSALLFTTSVLIFMMGLVSEQICQMRFERSEGDKFV
jgi:glycosyltransferase involved in cell wall biosynthesis